MKLILKRAQANGVNTKGKLSAYTAEGSCVFSCDTLELAWKDNARNISCIPPGTYSFVRHVSDKLGDCLLLVGVPDRDFILIHAGNYASSDIHFKTDIEGCILVGEDYRDLNNDGVIDIGDSLATLEKLLAFFPIGSYEIDIHGVN